jgi:pimeloyl-ACP methyl ester carboxylesterase
MWHVGDALTDIARVTNVHLPGYDGSPALVPYEEELALRAIEQALQDASISSPILVGFSLGAFRALELARRESAAVRGVKGVVCLAGFHDLTHDHRQALSASAALARDPSKDLATLFTPHFLSASGMTNPAWVAEVGTWFEVVSREDLALELETAARTPAVDVGALRVPVLARVGDADLAAPKVYSELLVKAAANARLEIVNGIGHALILEDAAATARSVRDFVLAVSP